MSGLDLKDEHPGGEMPRPAARDGNAQATTGKDGLDPAGRSDSPPFAGKFVRRHPVAVAIVAVMAVAVAAGGVMWWLQARNYESTDDAFIDTRTVSITSQVAGMITSVPVTDNQFVDTGGLLVQVDPRDYEAAVAQAMAQTPARRRPRSPAWTPRSTHRRPGSPWRNGRCRWPVSP